MSKIKKFANRDRLAFEAISKVGKVTSQHLIDNIPNLKQKRIDNYVRDGILQKVYVSTSKYQETECYQFTPLGKKIVQGEFGIDSFYKANGNGHDLVLADKYFSLSDTEKETWKTETELQQEFKQYLDYLKYHDEEKWEDIYHKYETQEISVCDASYTLDSGQQVVFEATTNSYGQAVIEAKIEFCNVMNYPPPTFQKL